ncbi:S-layer domain protein [Desulfofarcimen acetoxidans DSM 771]|uniref:S-layer domain protein n=1 Tax=Desulfofarcimen acetoxidans (strain ATCC 49208 / DSM 771 / KCTC 5769 / VKM B-1644 / 5575) TaxID=485916 RepID=C8W6V5_DESAS|nr:S-layer homology domain-containing protein [Desulfofarcimen acetoxidans]ACV64214.1 S-layer domain protein [Desulfofarcimen acetoxidans DSM 771]
MRILRIRKNLLCILMILAILLPLTGVGYAGNQGVAVNLTSPGAHQVYKPGDTVEISGTAQGLAEVSIAVRNEQGGLAFTAQPRVQDGVFTTGFTLEASAAEGQYTINIGCLGLPDLRIYRFQVQSAGGAAVSLNKPVADSSFKAGDVVEIEGTAQRTGSIAICVRNSNNGRVYVAQPPIENGSFATAFTLAADAVGGTYTINVTGDGLAAAQIYQFTVTSGGTGPGGGTSDKPDAILFINGNGVAKQVSYTRAELEAMDQERDLFSATNDWPQDLFEAAEGVPLRTLLDQAEMSPGAQMITFTGSDGYYWNYTVDELLNTTRYKFPGQTPVEPLIALKRVEASSNFGNMTESETPVLCFGQRIKSDYTLMGFVKHLKYITVNTNSPGKWSKPTAQIIDPDTKQKTATQGGQIKSGSKIVLQSEPRTKLRYTTDGSNPDINSKMYNVSAHVPSLNVPIVVNQDTTIKAMAEGNGKLGSDVLTLMFTVAGGTPVAPVGGSGGLVPQQTVSEENIKKEEISLEKGRKGEKLTLQEGVLEDIEKGTQGSRLAVNSTALVDEVNTEVSSTILQKAKEKGMLLGINSAIGNYTLPLDSLNLDEIAAGMDVKPKELNMNIVISRAAEDVKNKLVAGIQAGQEMLVDPVEFSIEISAPGGKKVEYKSFGSNYVEREIELDKGVNAGCATGAVWNEAKNRFKPVPTRFETRDGKSYAIILNRTNSLYTVLQSSKSFSDIQGNWAKDDIEMLAGKMLISGKNDTTYEPDSNITRAEFATLLVRALALEEGVLHEGQFKDVLVSDWYAGSVAAATGENIIAGYDGGLFKPADNITREKVAVMIARAARVAGKEDTLSASEQVQQLDQFKDKKEIASWATKDVALAVKIGIIEGMPGGNFAPKANADRAQSAVMLKRFLTYINFISTDQPVEQQIDNNQSTGEGDKT